MNPPITVVVDASAVHRRSGGVATYLDGILPLLAGHGVQTHVVTSRLGSVVGPGSLGEHALAPDARPARLLWEQVGLLGAVRKLRPPAQVLHSPHYTMPRYTMPHATGRGGRRIARVVTVHDLTFFTHPNMHSRSKRELFTRAIRFAARHADALVCVSATTADLLAEVVEVRTPVHVIPHGVDHARFHPHRSQEDAVQRRRLGLERPYVLFVGAIEPRKNVARLVQAYERLVPEHPDMELVIAGQPWAGQTVPAVARGSVRRLGFVDEAILPALVRGAVALAYPSLAEGFGLPVIEALACGTPVVTGASGATAEVAGGAAVLVDPVDIGSIADGLAVAIRGEGPALGARLARAAAFTWERSAAAHAAVYRSAGGSMERARPPR